MKLDFSKTKIIMECLRAYYEILSIKAHRSPDEIRLFTGLQPILFSMLNNKKQDEKEDSNVN
tara:strand:+ start:35 stop:220 length:186 start_codon:yes stop_codon:yes gene_type:complete